LYIPRLAVIETAKGQHILWNYWSTHANSFRSFVEFETAADLKTAVEKLDGREFKGVRVTCVADVCVVLLHPFISTNLA
jgi:RNA recognition motif. (a.k.a. RRM, RBD, or RNP domain)